MLSFGARSIPSDLALEASDTLTLYEALVACGLVNLDHLQPSKFFPDPGFLRQKDILRYEAALKDVIDPLISAGDSQNLTSPLQSIIRHLEDSVMQQIPKALLNSAPPRDRFRSNLIYLVSDLHVNGDLVRKYLDNLWQLSDVAVYRHSQQFYFLSTEVIVKSWLKAFCKPSRALRRSGDNPVPNGTKKSVIGRNGNYMLKNGNGW